MCPLAVTREFSPTEFPNSRSFCRSARIKLPFCMVFSSFAFVALLQAQFRHKLCSGSDRNRR
jgi:hypothetical protein